MKKLNGLWFNSQLSCASPAHATSVPLVYDAGECPLRDITDSRSHWSERFVHKNSQISLLHSPPFFISILVHSAPSSSYTILRFRISKPAVVRPKTKAQQGEILKAAEPTRDEVKHKDNWMDRVTKEALNRNTGSDKHNKKCDVNVF